MGAAGFEPATSRTGTRPDEFTLHGRGRRHREANWRGCSVERPGPRAPALHAAGCCCCAVCRRWPQIASAAPVAPTRAAADSHARLPAISELSLACPVGRRSGAPRTEPSNRGPFGRCSAPHSYGYDAEPWPRRRRSTGMASVRSDPTTTAVAPSTGRVADTSTNGNGRSAIPAPAHADHGRPQGPGAGEDPRVGPGDECGETLLL
jgi:hypothetical protein